MHTHERARSCFGSTRRASDDQRTATRKSLTTTTGPTIRSSVEPPNTLCRNHHAENSAARISPLAPRGACSLTFDEVHARQKTPNTPDNPRAQTLETSNNTQEHGTQQPLKKTRKQPPPHSSSRTRLSSYEHVRRKIFSKYLIRA